MIDFLVTQGGRQLLRSWQQARAHDWRACGRWVEKEFAWGGARNCVTKWIIGISFDVILLDNNLTRLPIRTPRYRCQFFSVVLASSSTSWLALSGNAAGSCYHPPPLGLKAVFAGILINPIKCCRINKYVNCYYYPCGGLNWTSGKWTLCIIHEAEEEEDEDWSS